METFEAGHIHTHLREINRAGVPAAASTIPAALARANEAPDRIVFLNCDSNRLTFDGAQSLAKCLPHLVRLEYFSVSNNHFTDTGCMVIGVALGTLKHLCVLNFGFNSCGNLGAMAIAATLSPTLQVLVLKFNNIGDDGAVAIAAAAAAHPALAVIEMQSNQYQDRGESALEALPLMNPRIMHLSKTHIVANASQRRKEFWSPRLHPFRDCRTCTNTWSCRVCLNVLMSTSSQSWQHEFLARPRSRCRELVMATLLCSRACARQSCSRPIPQSRSRPIPQDVWIMVFSFWTRGDFAEPAVAD